MWLLSTDRAELHYFASPEDVKDGYAILSHVWNTDGPEQTFEETRQLAAALEGSSESPRDRATRKISGCCKLAEKQGFRWLWIDTCCIDKTSSTELSEAINSMFRYYQLASICYVYLYDVAPKPPKVSDLGSVQVPRGRFHPVGYINIYDERLSDTLGASRRSRWHSRGWTLQELLAPELVAFFSRGWQLLGSKTDLSPLLEEITRIPQPVLTLQTPLSAVSISERMRWAARRTTTRQEDEAYCLLGIFDINMPLLYGEGGPKAFLRLQEEIMKQTRDTTLFAWMRTHQSSLSLQSTLPRLSDKLDTTADEHTHSADEGAIPMYLFARSPRDFNMFSLSMRFDLSLFEEVPHSATPLETMTSPGVNHRPGNFPTFSITPYGVLAHIPAIELQGGKVLIALLGWTSSAGKRYGLLLTRCPNASESSYHLYDVGIRGQRLVEIDLEQALDVSDLPGFSEQLPAPNWMDVYLLQKPPQDNLGGTTRPDTASLVLAVLTTSLIFPFRFTRHNLDSLQCGEGSKDLTRLHSISCKNVLDEPWPWTGVRSPITFTFNILTHFIPDTRGRSLVQQTVFSLTHSKGSKDWEDDNCQGKVVLQLGCCSTSPLSPTSPASGPHWAKVRLLPATSADVEASSITESSDHDCLVDHICEWPNWRKETAIVLPQPVGECEFCTMTLSFSESPHPVNSTSLFGDIAVSPMSIFFREDITGSPQEVAEGRRRLLTQILGGLADITGPRSAFEVIPKEYWPEPQALETSSRSARKSSLRVRIVAVDQEHSDQVRPEFEFPHRARKTS